jgi:hypothetical protein
MKRATLPVPTDLTQIKTAAAGGALASKPGGSAMKELKLSRHAADVEAAIASGQGSGGEVRRGRIMVPFLPIASA